MINENQVLRHLIKLSKARKYRKITTIAQDCANDLGLSQFFVQSLITKHSWYSQIGLKKSRSSMYFKTRTEHGISHSELHKMWKA